MNTTNIRSSNFQEGLPYISECINGLEYVVSKSKEFLEEGICCGQSTWFSRAIHTFTQTHLPPATAKITSTFIQIIPYIIASLFLPPIPLAALTIICTYGRLERNPSLKNPINDFECASTIELIAYAVHDLTTGIMTRNPIKIFKGCLEAIGMYILGRKSGLFADLTGCYQEIIHM